MFWDIFCKECDKLNKKPNKIASELGLSYASTTRWKDGTIPSGETLVKLARYFNCSIDYLLGITEDPTPERRIIVRDTLEPEDSIFDRFIKLFKGLPFTDQVELMERAVEMKKSM